MKLFFSPASPYVRKVLATAHELGLADRIEKLPSAAGPVKRDQTIIAHNPLGQVPTLLTDDGAMLADSRVICEYLNDLGGGSLFGADKASRWQVITDQAMADGVMGAALLIRYETFLRPEGVRWADWVSGQWDKIFTTLDHFEGRAAELAGRMDIGTITLAAALSYIDFRMPDVDWRGKRPGLAAWAAAYETRPAMVATRLSA